MTHSWLLCARCGERAIVARLRVPVLACPRCGDRSVEVHELPSAVAPPSPHRRERPTLRVVDVIRTPAA